MANIPYPPERQLSVGEVLDLTFRIYRATLVKCLLYAGLAVIAGQLANIYTIVRGHPLAASPENWQQLLAQLRDPTLWVLYVVGALLTIVFYGAVLLRQRGLIGGSAAGAELSAALGRLPALIGMVILIVLGCIALFVPAYVTSGALRALLLIAAVVVLCYAVVAISCAQTILFIEGAGPAASLSRSWRLTSGSFWRLSVIYTVALIILFVLYAVSAAVAGFLAAVLGRGDFAMVTAFAELGGVVLGALAMPFYSALALAVLGDLKVRKEGADLEQRISSATA
jgi:hypothetical protein